MLRKGFLFAVLATGTALVASAAHAETCYQRQIVEAPILGGCSDRGYIGSADFEGSCTERMELIEAIYPVPCPPPPSPPTPPTPPTPPPAGGAVWVSVNVHGAMYESVSGSTYYPWGHAETCTKKGLVPATINGSDCKSVMNPNGSNVRPTATAGAKDHAGFMRTVSGNICASADDIERSFALRPFLSTSIPPTDYACKPPPVRF